MLEAQDSTLPQGPSRIYLLTGKEIKQVRLWRIDTVKVEYVKNENLGDVDLSDVEKIETPVSLILFDSRKRMLIRNYDVIIPYYGDTIRCFIQKADKYQILFTETGSGRQKILLKNSVKEYFQWPEKEIEHSSIKVSLEDSVSKTKANVDSVKNAQASEVKVQSGVMKDSLAEDQKTGSAQTKKQEKVGEAGSGEMTAFYYHQSYQRGVSDAEKNYRGGWGARAFFFGLFYGGPYVTSSAANSEERCSYVPDGVDAKLYKKAYEQTSTMVKVKKASTGAAAAKGVVTAIIFLIIVL